MATPILLIKYPHLSGLEMENLQKKSKSLIKKFYDYHVLFLPNNNIKDIEVTVFNSDKIKPIELKKLKEEINKRLKVKI